MPRLKRRCATSLHEVLKSTLPSCWSTSLCGKARWDDDKTNVATVAAEDTVNDCAANSYGGPIINFFGQHPCRSAGRRLVTIPVNGRTVALSIIIGGLFMVEMLSVVLQIAVFRTTSIDWLFGDVFNGGATLRREIRTKTSAAKSAASSMLHGTRSLRSRV